MNSNISSIEEIEKISQILFSNQNKINFLRNSYQNNNMFQGILKFLTGFEIDIKNILSLLERIKFNINQNTNKDIIICGNCDCCKFCNCSTNNCSENQINISNDNIPNNEYIKEIINLEEENNNNDFNKNNLPINDNNYRTYQYSYPYNNNAIRCNNNLNNNNINNINSQPIEGIYKNSAITKSKRFQVNKSLDNIKAKSPFPIKKAKIIRHFNLTETNNINNNLNQKKKKLNKNEKFLNKLNEQPKEIINRFKNIYGIDIEQKLLNNEINAQNLNEMENILDKIIKMSIWGEKEKNIRKKSEDKNSTKRIKFKYNPIQEKVKLKQALINKRAQYKEYPRGWYSTKEYFINNGTAINNDDAFI